MATALTHFEIKLPAVDYNPSAQAALNNFITSLQTLCNVFIYNADQFDAQLNENDIRVLYGEITAAQQATALGFLNTLNTALGTPVACSVWAVTKEP